jgi:hypothetical protein
MLVEVCSRCPKSDWGIVAPRMWVMSSDLTRLLTHRVTEGPLRLGHRCLLRCRSHANRHDVDRFVRLPGVAADGGVQKCASGAFDGVGGLLAGVAGYVDKPDECFDARR